MAFIQGDDFAVDTDAIDFIEKSDDDYVRIYVGERCFTVKCNFSDFMKSLSEIRK